MQVVLGLILTEMVLDKDDKCPEVKGTVAKGAS
jgi:hypothetical protein